jgi:3-oxoacyl-[acyl-carrier protein] reductase
MTTPSSIALITGASSGIGRAIAVRLASDGFHILAHYNSNKTGAEKTLSLLPPGQADLIQFDMRDSAGMKEKLDQYFENSTCALEVLVNNAGMHDDTLTGLMSDAQFEEVVRTNLFGPFYLMRWGLKKMLKNRKGSIINISSLSGQVGNAGQINYAASKGGLIAMTKTLSKELGPRGIRVNSVSPGLIETEMLDAIPHLEEIKKQIPLQRLGTPIEVAHAVSFLASSQASYITGQTISVNGGLFPA